MWFLVSFSQGYKQRKHMLSNLVLAYPEIKSEDYEWIQLIRKKYDDYYFNVVEPHFTIVFPVFNSSVRLLSQHIRKISEATHSIKFNLRSTTIVKDSFSDVTNVFLVPDIGNSEIIKLHDKLYTDILRKELRLDIPFIPHIAIAGSNIAEEAKELSDKINEEVFEITGEIKKLDLIEYEHPMVKTLEVFALQ